jgi:hypothetical protein
MQDMIHRDELSDAESVKVLKGFDIAESGHWIEQLDSRMKTKGNIQKEQYG